MAALDQMTTFKNINNKLTSNEEGIFQIEKLSIGEAVKFKKDGLEYSFTFVGVDNNGEAMILIVRGDGFSTSMPSIANHGEIRMYEGDDQEGILYAKVTNINIELDGNNSVDMEFFEIKPTDTL